jgi:hypothetical protein
MHDWVAVKVEGGIEYDSSTAFILEFSDNFVVSWIPIISQHLGPLDASPQQNLFFVWWYRMRESCTERVFLWG